MPTFDQLWQLFLDRGALANRREETANLWYSYSPQQQQQIFDAITNKLNQGRFVHYNPVQAIRENARPSRASYAEPTDWNGKRAPEPTEIACYNGHWGMYTLTDIRKFGLQTKQKAGN